MLKQPKVQPNDYTKSGKLASKKVIFGEFNRYAVAAVHCRKFPLRENVVMWFVWDAEQICPLTNLPVVIRQNDDFQKAIAGLERE